jgi:hypothetical protein
MALIIISSGNQVEESKLKKQSMGMLERVLVVTMTK